MDYSPFGDTQLIDIEGPSLSNLRAVSEGWYIEYKEEVPNVSSIAKSISSFANTYGGWVFYGIKEKSKGENVAGEFVGIHRSELSNCLHKIRNAVSDNIQPTPHYEQKVVWGPSEEIGLEADKAIICLQIPSSVTAPHIHKKGVIYRRVSDGSDPKPETDRFVLDQLWQRSEKIRESFSEWIKDDPEFSERENENPYIRIMIKTDLWQHQHTYQNLTVHDLRSILELPKVRSSIPKIPFDTIHSSADGFVARQLAGNNPDNLTLTWLIRKDGTSDIFIPVKMLIPDNLNSISSLLINYKNSSDFERILDHYKYERPIIADLNETFLLIMGIVGILNRINDFSKFSGRYFIKTKLLNSWRITPFIDSELLINDFKKFGISMCLKRNITSPPGLEPESFLEISPPPIQEDEMDQVLMPAIGIFEPIAQAFGLHNWTHEAENISSYVSELYNAGMRAVEQRDRVRASQ